MHGTKMVTDGDTDCSSSALVACFMALLRVHSGTSVCKLRFTLFLYLPHFLTYAFLTCCFIFSVC